MQIAALHINPVTQIPVTTSEILVIAATSLAVQEAESQVPVQASLNVSSMIESTFSLDGSTRTPDPANTTIPQSVNTNVNIERRFIHLGATAPQHMLQQQIRELQAEVQQLKSKQQQDSNVITVATATVTSAPPVISIVSRKPIFPNSPPCIYAEGKKLKGRKNYVPW